MVSDEYTRSFYTIITRYQATRVQEFKRRCIRWRLAGEKEIRGSKLYKYGFNEHMSTRTSTVCTVWHVDIVELLEYWYEYNEVSAVTSTMNTVSFFFKFKNYGTVGTGTGR